MGKIDEVIFLMELTDVLKKYNLQDKLYKRELCYDEGFEEIFYYVRIPVFWSIEHKNKVFKKIHDELYEFCSENDLMDFLKDTCIIFV